MTATGTAAPVIRRPRTVTAAAAAMMLLIAVGLANSVVLLVDDNTASEEEAVAAAIAVSMVISVLYAVLAAFVLHGRQGARITTWVASGLLLVPISIVTVFYVIAGAWLAGGYGAYLTGLAITLFVLHTAVVVLLAVRSTNRYFRDVRRLRADKL